MLEDDLDLERRMAICLEKMLLQKLGCMMQRRQAQYSLLLTRVCFLQRSKTL